MNDRYLFRGKRVDNGEWVIGYYHQAKYFKSDDDLIDFITIPHPDIKNADNDIFIVIPETVGQCTGLKDKNGKLIFEWDILMFTNDDGEKTPYKVKWSTSLAQYIISMGDRIFDTMDYWDKWIEYYEIIGNTHDNPELLEVER